jgi:hypothetical protein
MMAFSLGEVARIHNLRVSTCARKIRHETFREAYAHRESVVWRYGEELRRPLHVYRCKDCGGWHVGSRRVVETGS